MLFQDAAFSYLHFVFAFLIAGSLAAEAFVLRLPVTAPIARLLLHIDTFYGIAAVGMIVAGVARVFWGAKGAAYYAHQPFFWVKMALFALVGLVSIAPTLAYFRWNKAGAANANFVVGGEQKRVRRLVMIELHVFALVPLAAALMARGIGG